MTVDSKESCMDVPHCIQAEIIRLATLDNEHLAVLSEYVWNAWPLMKAEVQKELQPYWSLRDEIAIID